MARMLLLYPGKVIILIHPTERKQNVITNRRAPTRTVNPNGGPNTELGKAVSSRDISANASMEDLAAGSIASAIQDLGLRLETRTAPAKFIIIDKADKIPTGN